MLSTIGKTTLLVKDLLLGGAVESCVLQCEPRWGGRFMSVGECLEGAWGKVCGRNNKKY